MVIKERLFKLGKKFKYEKKRILNQLGKTKKSEPLILASPEWLKGFSRQNDDNPVFTIINEVTINNQKYEFWIKSIEPITIINSQRNWILLNHSDDLKKFNANKSNLQHRIFAQKSLSSDHKKFAKTLQSYYSRNFIKINNAIILNLSQTNLHEVKENLESIQKTQSEQKSET